MPKNFVKIAGRVLPFFILVFLAGCGGGGSNNAAGGAAPSAGGATSPSPSLALFAGDMQVSGSTDGVGAAARFYVPQGIAAESAGNVYVADSGNSTIRKITPEGVVSTFAGAAGLPGSSDSTDGTGATARFENPNTVSTDSAGNVYVTDGATIRKITPAGVVTTLAGTAGVRGFSDGTGPAASFTVPYGGATDSVGNVYVVDSNACQIRKITPAGVVTTIAGLPVMVTAGHCSGAGRAANGPFGVATDSADNLYVSSAGDQSIYKMTAGGFIVTTFAGTGSPGSTDSTGTTASFYFPNGLATDSAGNIYVADSGNDTIRKITPEGVVSTVVGLVGQPGFTPGPLPGLLSSPIGVAVSGTSLYILINNGVAVVNNRL
ncbi:MAG: NHL domain-containing protein [Sulfuricaulis sp.]